MRVSEVPVLRRFWYCVLPSASLEDRPVGIRLLDEPVVLWRDRAGVAHAVKDRCLHRTARLSLGYVENDNIICPYHGWAFAGDGACVRVPQDVEDKPVPFAVPGYRCTERYNHIWVALEEPLFDIPSIPEFEAAEYRQVIEFHEIWQANPLRVIENAFDAAHIAFVHRESFGSSDPTIGPFSLTDTEDGFTHRNDIGVVNRPHMKEALRTTEDTTVRHTENSFHLPFSRVGRIRYPNGLENILCTFLTPIDDGHCQFTQWVLRNDTEADVPAEKVIAFDRQVTIEDKLVIESTDLNVPLNASEGRELHMAFDRPGVRMRKMLHELSVRGGR